MTDTITIRVTGVSYHSWIEPSPVPKREGWPEPRIEKKGRGYTVFYTCTRDQAVQIAAHLERFEPGMYEPDDHTSRQDARAAQSDARRIRAALRGPTRYAHT